MTTTTTTTPTSLNSMEPPPEMIGEVFEHCFASGNITGIQALACTNKQFNKSVAMFAETIKLEEFCPLLKIISAAQAQKCGFQAAPTSFFPKLKLINAYQAMSPHIENNAGVTYFNFTLQDDLTLRKIVEIAKSQGIEVSLWQQTLPEIGDVAIAQVFPCMLANNVFKDSRKKSFADQCTLVHEYGCELPTLEQYIIHIVLIQKISDQRLFGGDNSFLFSRSVTRVKNTPLLIGGPSQACIRVSSRNCNANKHDGAGGRRKF